MKKAIVDTIFKERYKNDSNSQTLSTTLNQWIDSIFSEPDRILYELLQNADDAAIDSEEGVHYDIYLLDHHLVINYNGKAFDEEDLRSLCDVGASAKTKQSHKIGYKGIGFKSVFRISDCVWIVSDGACIRFDKHYQNQGKQGYPWQIVPIWTNMGTLPKETQEICAGENISIILKIGREEEGMEVIRQNLNKIYSDYKMILFLRNVEEITCFRKENEGGRGLGKGEIKRTLRVLRTDDEAQGTRHIEVKIGHKPAEIHKFLVHQIDLDIPQNIQEALAEMPANECPEKLKIAQQTQITLAVPVDSTEHLAPSKDFSNIYCYLPTSIKKNIPYHINAEFLTVANRSKLLRDNAWNDWLFEAIGYQQFEWIRSVVQMGYFKYQIPALIRMKYTAFKKKDWDYSIKKAFNKGVEEATKVVAFLPEHNSDALAFVAESVVDNTSYSFSSSEAANLVKQEIQGSYNITSPKIIDPAIEDLDKIIQLGAKEFNIGLLQGMLNSQGYAHFAEPQKNEALILFLAGTIGQLDSMVDKDRWNEALSTTNFLLTDQEKLRAPVDLYFSQPNFDFGALEGLVSPSVLHETVYEKISYNLWALDWLREVQVKNLDHLELLQREVVDKILAQDDLNLENIISITRFIFKYYSQLNPVYQQKIQQGLKVLTKKKNLVYPTEAYLADLYKPTLAIEARAQEIEILSEAYVEDPSPRIIATWQNFFSEKLGVQKQMSVKKCPTTSLEGIQQLVPYGADYVEYLKQELNAEHFEVENLFFVTFTEELTNEHFATLFWERLLHAPVVLENIMQRENQVKALVANEKIAVPSLFKFYVQHFDSFPLEGGTCLPTAQIYSTRLKNWWAKAKPIAAFEMDARIENYLGIQNTISVADYLELLTYYSQNSEQENYYEQIVRLYLELSVKSNALTEEERTKIKDWGLNHPLLAQDNSFQIAQELYYFDIKGQTAPAQNGVVHYIKLDKSIPDPIDLCHLFGVNILQESDLKVEKEGAVEESTLKEQLTHLAGALALDFTIHYGGDWASKTAEILERVEKSSFWSCEKIQMAYRNEKGDLIFANPILSWVEDKAIFYEMAWDSIDGLYDLMPQLCAYLELKDRARELQLILMMPPKGLLAWFKNLGASEEILDALSLQLNNKFVLEDPPVNYKTKNGKSQLAQRQQNNYPDGKTGYKGEKWVVEQLQQKYASEDCKITWLNEQAEQKEAYDILLEIGDQTYYIDVKTTSSKEARTVLYMSHIEYEFMQEHSDCYQIYRVSDIDGTPRCQILKWEDWSGIVLGDGFWVDVAGEDV